MEGSAGPQMARAGREGSWDGTPEPRDEPSRPSRRIIASSPIRGPSIIVEATGTALTSGNDAGRASIKLSDEGPSSGTTHRVQQSVPRKETVRSLNLYSRRVGAQGLTDLHHDRGCIAVPPRSPGSDGIEMRSPAQLAAAPQWASNRYPRGN